MNGKIETAASTASAGESIFASKLGLQPRRAPAPATSAAGRPLAVATLITAP